MCTTVKFHLSALHFAHPDRSKSLPYTHGCRGLAFPSPSCESEVCPKHQPVLSLETRDGYPQACPSLPPLTVIDFVPLDPPRKDDPSHRICRMVLLNQYIYQAASMMLTETRNILCYRLALRTRPGFASLPSINTATIRSAFLPIKRLHARNHVISMECGLACPRCDGVGGGVVNRCQMKSCNGLESLWSSGTSSMAMRCQHGTARIESVYLRFVSDRQRRGRSRSRNE